MECSKKNREQRIDPKQDSPSAIRIIHDNTPGNNRIFVQSPLSRPPISHHYIGYGYGVGQRLTETVGYLLARQLRSIGSVLLGSTARDPDVKNGQNFVALLPILSKRRW